MSRRICVVTGSRAEYGLLYWLMKGIAEDPTLELQIIATGMHLSPEFGLTYRAIEADGFGIAAKVEMLMSSDSPVGVAKSIGLGVGGIAEALDRLAPDMVILLGDRFEILAAAQAAMVTRVPIVHLGGGDIGSGTYDNISRHCITKMASVHFVTHEDARRRVIQLGERSDNVFCFGATSVDNVLKIPLLSKVELQRDLGIDFENVILLSTFHPLTMGDISAEKQLSTLLSALDAIHHELRCSIIFTKSNADNGGRALNQILEGHVKTHSYCHLFDSLGQTRYLSVMKQASAVVGNSSSGLYEAPYLGTPTVDIGTRQEGRAAPTSVIRCRAEEDDIRQAIRKALAFDFSGVEMIYGDGNASNRILEKLKELKDLPALANKTFTVIGA